MSSGYRSDQGEAGTGRYLPRDVVVKFGGSVVDPGGKFLEFFEEDDLLAAKAPHHVDQHSVRLSDRFATTLACRFIGLTAYESRSMDEVLLGKFRNWSGEETFHRAIRAAIEHEPPGTIERAAVALGWNVDPDDRDDEFVAEFYRPTVHDIRLVSVATSRSIPEMLPSYDDDDG